MEIVLNKLVHGILKLQLKDCLGQEIAYFIRAEQNQSILGTTFIPVFLGIRCQLSALSYQQNHLEAKAW